MNGSINDRVALNRVDLRGGALDMEHPVFCEIRERFLRRMEIQMYIAMHTEPVVPTHRAPGVRPVRLLTTSRYDFGIRTR